MDAMDTTVTAAGGRLLEDCCLPPPLDILEIRHAASRL